MAISVSNPIAYVGGTFNPVHFGHLRVATELGEALGVAQVMLMPCFQPVHRQEPGVTADQRLAMLRLAIADDNQLDADAREIERGGASYTVDSLRSIRAEQGTESAIYFAMGADAFNRLQSWKDWQQLFDLANVVVMHRPGSVIDWQCDFLRSRVKALDGIHQTAGDLFELEVSALDISSTDIRQRARKGRSIDYLLPPSVVKHIQNHQLYR
ncbi:putative nicotinate-nucleotide adenylyltransferase [BD1-7 clade bacterium]|uniref:Probable nicotinate-nucleotide adenylyltransferase n=1 Tax=BD1-7 clade bacterium TaxID=2029982 RepID=A0A5S9QXW3_9GAMM|nr:putative nicotinate-nucleotide adenylyltransferase [BD1-7 clade bacterium]